MSGVDGTGGIAGINQNHAVILDSFNTGIVTGDYRTGGVAGENNDTTTVSACYNTGPVSGAAYIGGVIGSNGEPFFGNAISQDCYNTGPVSGDSNIGGLVGINRSKGAFLNSFNTGAVAGNTNIGSVIGCYGGGSIDNCSWLESTNADGIGTGSGITVSSFTHTDPTLAEVYSDMEEITENAGNDSGGAVSEIVFGGGDMIPAAFDPLQGAYVYSSDQRFSVYAISDDVTVTVKIGADLSDVISDGGTAEEPTLPGGIEYDLTGLLTGTWVAIKAEYALQPEKNRFYVLFRKNW